MIIGLNLGVDNMFQGIFIALKTVAFALVYAFIMIPFAFFCFAAAFLFLPLDAIAYIFSGGNVDRTIFSSFQAAAGRCLSWFAENIND